MLLLLVLLSNAAIVCGEYTRDLEVSEAAPVGTRIGFIEDGVLGENGSPYLIVTVQGIPVDTDLDIDQKTGEIKTKVMLDRETRSSYNFVAVPIYGQNIHVSVRVIDENDNAPVFAMPIMNVEFPENTPKDVKRTLNPARDLDIGNYNTQKYNIVSGNVNQAFKLSYQREKDGVLYLDLQINGILDRETTSSYALIIEAIDGGVPPLKGTMTVNVLIQDVNDNPPVFNQTRYFGTVPENATVGTSIIKVHATDADSGDNGVVEYTINHRQSDRDGFFDIDSSSGLIIVNKPLDFETKEVHELVVVAKDRGMQPLETTAFISIKVTDVNDNQPLINLIFLSDDATPKISEGAGTGEFVARISVHDPDSKNEYSNVNVTLEGGEGHFGLTTQDNIIYLVVISMPLDREFRSNYTLNVVATDTGLPPLHAFKTFNMLVTDINDNSPEFEQSQFYTNVLEIAEPGSSVFQVQATDKDEGINSELTYTIMETTDNRPSWFEIDASTGLITTKTHVDCDTDSMPKLIVVAADHGSPSLSSSATVFVTIHDVDDNEPVFSHTFYNVTISEDKSKGSCILKVSAVDSDCGLNAVVNYTLLDAPSKNNPFYVKSISGEICIASDLDYEVKQVYEFLVIATDRGGLSATSAVRITLTDVNDNEPVFSPLEYHVTVRDNVTGYAPIAVVRATDADSGHFSTVSYRISSGNDENLFRIDRSTGELFLLARITSLPQNRQYVLNVSATDSAGVKCMQEAQAFITIANSIQFERFRYVFNVSEDVPLNTPLGRVKINTHLDEEDQRVRYFIHSGVSTGWFSLDPFSGILKTAGFLDYEKHRSVFLNIQAVYGNAASSTFTQIIINLEDKNDNAPEFDSNSMRLSVPESMAAGSPLLSVFTRDQDSGAAGTVHYVLRSSSSTSEARLFAIDAATGVLTLTSSLDYETSQHYSLVITAYDEGEPRLQSNMTIFLDVQDMNDNTPVFEQSDYSIVVSESLPSHSQILQVTAVDLDTGNNAKISYKLMDVSTDIDQPDFVSFGVSPNSGWIYLKSQLDRETTSLYTLKIMATDNGVPKNTATAIIKVTVSDYNDNDPQFFQDLYEFSIEENRPQGTIVGMLQATDKDADNNAVIRYSLIPNNSSFHINTVTGVLSTREPLDREVKSTYELVAEARDQGVPPRSSRIVLRIKVTDINDNAPVLDDPQEDVISVREEQPPGTEVVHVRAVDPDEGYNATITYSILKGRETDSYGVFTIDPLTGIVRTKSVLDHEERSVYRIAVAAADNGVPPKQTVRVLRIEVLGINDNRPTFSSSSLFFKIYEDVPIGFVIGNVIVGDNSGQANRGHVIYKLSFIYPAEVERPFDIDRRSGSLVVVKELDREVCAEYRLEVRIQDTSANPQSSAVSVKIEVLDINDNAPKWKVNPLRIMVPEDSLVGSTVWNFSATDADSGTNSELRYSLTNQWPLLDISVFSIDFLTGNLIVTSPLDYEKVEQFTLVIKVTDQATNISERLSTSLSVQVLIQDINDNVPVIISPVSRSLFIGSIQSEGTCIDHVLAVDLDSGDNGRVSYMITAGNEAGYFFLHQDSGDLTIARSVNYAENFILNITATDHGSPVPLYSTFWLNITSQTNEANQPSFTEEIYSVNVSEDLSVDSIVFSISSAIIEYSIDKLHNLKYEISVDMVDNVFTLNENDNTILLKKPLDRETQDRYTIPLYVRDTMSGKFDSTVLLIVVMDVNDNTPMFKRGSCFPLHIPENMEFSIIHTVVAIDGDTGNNAKIIYSISEGNVGNQFIVNSNTGELSAQPLDRELQSHYYLTISAQDQGSSVSLIGYCNITIIVEDENDNGPQFEKSLYFTSVYENISIGTTVLMVKAVDVDLDLNSRIIYFFKNKTDCIFLINNQTGAISTSRKLDREKQSVYVLQVVACDSGRYRSQCQTANVQITVEDVNDNRPQFAKYPYSVLLSPYVHVGSEVVKVLATDGDKGDNGEITYKISNDNQISKFRINSNTGAITVASNLTLDMGKMFYIEVIATDKGNSPMSSSCLVEIKMDGNYEGSRATLRFQNASYSAFVSENAYVGENVIQVFALRNDGRRQKIIYSFANGNENEPFEINPQTGLIRVRNVSMLDYEMNPQVHLTLAAQTENTTGSTLYAFADLTVYLSNQNDNAPVFSQEWYFASILEGISRGTHVIQLLAIDADTASDSHVSYHIVDGNHDNAFIIESPTSNIIKTNIVLDAEIRSMYKLTVIATDDGIPQLTGTATIRINVIDVNDNQPSFPPFSKINISENAPAGSVITSVIANDVDTFPSLVYLFEDEDKAEILSTFAIDRYSGRIILKHQLDFEIRNEYQLRITASDRKHSANTLLIVTVSDENDNPPVFKDLYYQFALSSTEVHDRSEMKVHAEDADFGNNSVVTYSLSSPVAGLHVDKHSGIITVNQTFLHKKIFQKGFFDIRVKATDSGVPERSSFVPVRFDTRYGFQWNSLVPLQAEYRISVRENVPRGKVILRLYPHNAAEKRLQFNIIFGNEDGHFDIFGPNGDLVLLKLLDREQTDVYSLHISVGHNMTSTRVHIIVEDVNDNAPQFSQYEHDMVLSENTPIGKPIINFHTTDKDLPPNSDVRYEITSGNDYNLFTIDSVSGMLTLRKALDYDLGIIEHELIIKATDIARPPADLPLCSLASLKISVTDENDHEPKFPISEYLEFVAENEPIGITVFTAKATDMDKGVYGRLNYSVMSAAASGYADVDDSWKLFRVHPTTGVVSTNSIFDYESRSRYAFTMMSCDIGGKCARVKVRVEIEGKDEFHPQFTERTFRFTLTGDVPVGYVVGHVTATDRDKGPDGRIVYQLTTQNPYFKINRTTGTIVVKKKLDVLSTDHDFSLVVGASSGRQGSLTNTSVVEIAFDQLFAPGVNLASSGTNMSTFSNLADWLIVFFVLFIIVSVGIGGFIGYLRFRNRHQKNVNKPTLNSSNQRVDTYVDPGAFDTIPIRGTAAHGVTQFAPPKYDEIPTYRTNNSGTNSAAATTSELSGSEQSGSSGRGSAEDGEDVDEEIRMINEGQSRGGRNPEDDNLSDVSVHNTQEYLARLGIIDSHGNSHLSMQNENGIKMLAHRGTTSVSHINMFDDDGANEADITNIIYTKLNDVASERGGSTQEDVEVDRNCSTGCATSIDRTIVLDGYQVPTGTQPSMSGSLSSIVHSEEELTGSYNWDYLLDWGPQYQPLAHVFSEIARLKDDAASVKSGISGTSSGKSKSHHSMVKTVPPPLLTNVAPRSITAPVINSRLTIQGHSTLHQNQLLLLPRSPISHDTVAGFSTSAAMSPSFSPSLSPLATRSPSVSPLHLHTMGSSHHHQAKQRHMAKESDIRI